MFDVRSFVCDKWGPFISQSPERTICHLIQADGCITVVVSRTNRITYLDLSPAEALVLAWLSDRCWRLRTVVLYVFMPLMPSYRQCMTEWLLCTLFSCGLTCAWWQNVAKDMPFICSTLSNLLIFPFLSPHVSSCSSRLPSSCAVSSRLMIFIAHGFHRWLRSAQTTDTLPGGGCVWDPSYSVRLREPPSVKPLFNQNQSLSLWQ